MANLVKYHLQVTALDTSSSALLTNKSALTSGITNTGNITTTGTVESSGAMIQTDDSGNRVAITVEDIGGGANTVVLTRL